jgi:protein TonB
MEEDAVQREGYAQQKSLSPTALTVTIAIHAAGLAALLLIRGDYIPALPKTFEPIFIPVPPPPPPPNDPPKPHAKNGPKIDTPKPVIGDTKTNPVGAIIIPPDPFPTGSASGGDAIQPAKIDPPLPVIVDPAPDPRYLRDFQPPYPPAMQRMAIEGKVVVRVLVGLDGRVKSAEIISSDDPAFSSATLRQALARWRFRAGTRDGVAVESWKTLTVRFEMKG